MSAQTLRDNTARFHRDNSLLNLIEVRNGNDVEPEAIHIRATEPVRSQENVEENENNEDEILENINEEEDGEIRIMRLRFDEILHTLKASTKENIEGRQRLMKLKKALDKLRYHNIKMKRIKIKDTRIRNNKMFQEDQGMFYRMPQGTNQQKGKVPKMEKFEKFWARIWEDNTKTLQRKWMNMVAQKIEQKVTSVQEFTITEKKLHQAVKKRKNWSAPGIYGVQNFWWKKFKGTWSAILRCFNQWLEKADEIPEWLTQTNSAVTKN